MIKYEADNDAARDHLEELLGRVGGHAALPLEVGFGRVELPEEFDPNSGVPRSAMLRSSMLEMINSALSVDVKGLPTLPFGSYALVQKLNAAFALDVEDAAPPFGVGAAIHEMWENFVAKAQNDRPWNRRFGAAHSAAVAVESRVVSELAGRPLNRVASLRHQDKGRVTYVLDYYDLFVTVSSVGGGLGFGRGGHSARTAAPATIGSVTLADAVALSEANKAVIAQAVTLLKENPLATAGVTGPLARGIRNAIAVALEEDVYNDEDDPGAGLAKEHDKGAGADLGDLRAFVDPAPGVANAPHGQIILRMPG
jgi:hypothetical protein